MTRREAEAVELETSFRRITTRVAPKRRRAPQRLELEAFVADAQQRGYSCTQLCNFWVAKTHRESSRL